MQKYAYNQISLMQYIFLLYKTQLGIGVFTLPRIVAEDVGHDGWISILLGYMLSNIVSILVIKLMEKHPDQTLYEILPCFFGKWVGNLINIILILFTLIGASIVIFGIISIVQVWSMPKSHQFVLMLLFLVPVYLVTKQGVRNISNYAQFVFLFTMWQPLLIMSTIYDAEILNFLPIFSEGIPHVLEGVRGTLFSFMGFEMSFFLYPFLKDKKHAIRGVIIANTLCLNILLSVTLICFSKFSQEEILDFIWPTLNLLKTIQTPVLERLEIPFLSFYLPVVLISVVTYLYISLLGITTLTKKSNHIPYLWIVLLAWTILSIFYTPSINTLGIVSDWWTEASIYIVFYFSVFLWGYSLIYHRWQKRGLG
ncbi:endospore germination permease [Hazenella sp. IB182357]|uniref:Endospore germination permease n=1 Tax=Polycladospora coralii TaxID=2771432 RepID=A0A926N7U3_9BACL|nr:endospore germination permease [Polycladospora coralii]MBD1370767.1 endospore germination permease [Polycladospora coralii]